jgi:hypothetical protein
MHRFPAIQRSLSAAVIAAMIAFPHTVAAQQAFKTPQAAVDALAAAAKSGDIKKAQIVLGQGSADILSSGDPVADKAAREKFVAAYDAKHQITMDGAGKAILVVGDKDFPFPIPIARQSNGNWKFNVVEGRREILFRRIGRNEFSAIETCLAFVDAENDYAEKDRGDGAGVYAQRFFSAEGKKDGLYWPTEEGQPPSPLGELFAQASSEGYAVQSAPSPYHGYYYKILTKQGPAAEGGAVDYVVNGKMIGGFALVAYPAQYRNSGVMTFMVNHKGVVYQKDLGWNTAQTAQAMTAFNPDASWKKVDTSFTANPDWAKTEDSAN